MRPASASVWRVGMNSWKARQPRAASAGCSVGVAGAVERHPRAPIVGDLVIVPLREHRDLGIERAQVPVEQVVFVVAAKVGERLATRDFSSVTRFLQISPFGKLALGANRTIGIDVVARMDEEVGRDLAMVA